MNEIEKMFENAKIKKQYCGWLDMGDLDCQMQYVRCNSVNEYTEAVFSSRFGETKEEPELKYPEFTAEKQLELIKWLIASGECYFAITIKPDEFEEYLAKYINFMWKDLADIDKEQIKEILK